MDYFIKEIKVGLTRNGESTGLIGGNVVVSMKFSDGNQDKWLNSIEIANIPNFYLSNNDIFDELLKEDTENEEYNDLLDKLYINSFNDIDLGEYGDIFISFENADKNDVKLIRIMIYLTRANLHEVDDIIKLINRKYVSEIKDLISDIEEDYIY